MKILIAIDKFKGSLTSLEAAQAIMRGIEAAAVASATAAVPELSSLELSAKGLCNTYEMVEIADGGDGSANVLLSVKNGVEVVPAEGVDPLGQKIESSYLVYYEPCDSAADSANSGAGSGAASGAASAAGSGIASAAADSVAGAGVLKKCAFIEMAKISGLELIPPVDSDGRRLRNPLVTTTYGLGQLIRKAYEEGARKITLSIGGSATNDGGTGMLQALGFKFYDKSGSLITDYMCGGLLSKISRIEAPSGACTSASGACEIEVICDVTNPLLGQTGATYVYGPQKGANPMMLQQLEDGMENLVRVALDQELPGHALHGHQVPAHLRPGAGAAGGVGYAVHHFLGGKIISGWRFFANLTNLKQKIANADLVISGEGRIDSQSLNGKVVDGVLTLAKEEGKPVWLFCGLNSLETNSLTAGSMANQPAEYPIFQLASLEPDRDKSMQNAAPLLQRLAREAATSHMNDL